MHHTIDSINIHFLHIIMPRPIHVNDSTSHTPQSIPIASHPARTSTSTSSVITDTNYPTDIIPIDTINTITSITIEHNIH